MDEHVDFSQVFEVDGSLRDLYVFETSLEDWRTFLGFVKSGPYPYIFMREETCELSLPVEDLFDADPAYMLSIDIDNITLNCHFYLPTEIELDLDPAEVRSSVHIERVLRFMATVGDLLHKQVLLTAENAADMVHLVYDPGLGDFTSVLPKGDN